MKRLLVVMIGLGLAIAIMAPTFAQDTKKTESTMKKKGKKGGKKKEETSEKKGL